MSSKSRRRIAEVTVLVSLLVAIGGFPGVVQGMEVGVQLVDVPIPEDTQGPFGMNMCLSPDGKQIAIAGNITAPNGLWNPEHALFYQLLNPKGGPLHKTFEKKIYVASSSPSSASDYSLLVENRRMSAILAMAISPTKPYQLAYVSREMEIEFPTDPRKAGWSLVPPYQPKSPRDLSPKGFREVLYVVPLSGGRPKAILTLEEDIKIKRLYDGLFDKSVCWNDDASALFYGDRVSVSRISLSGKRDVLYTFEVKTEPESQLNHTLASNVACRSGGLVEFLDLGQDLYRHGKAWKEVLSMRLVRVAQDGKGVQTRQWPQFPFYTPRLDRYPATREIHNKNPAVLGEETWAYLDARHKESKARLCVGTRSDPSKIVTYLSDVKPGKDLLQYALMGLSPDGTEVWLSQQVNYHDMSDADISRYVPTVPFTGLKHVNLRPIK